MPAWRGATVDPQDALRGGRGGGAGRSQHRALRSLVVFEIALSLMLLIGAGLVLKGFAGLLKNEPGFETDHVLTMRVTVPAASYAQRSAVPAFLEPALEAIRAIPRVQSVAAISCGIVDGEPLLDLDYPEDSGAEVDANVVMTGDGGLVEVQATAERTPLSRANLDALLALAQDGIEDLKAIQAAAV